MNKLGVKASTRAFVSGMSSAFDMVPKPIYKGNSRSVRDGSALQQDTENLKKDMQNIGNDFKRAMEEAL